jgi:hypothetical protein
MQSKEKNVNFVFIQVNGIDNIQYLYIYICIWAILIERKANRREREMTSKKNQHTH